MIHLGIDTSNYKTSLAAVDEAFGISVNISDYLDVPEGRRGLRQSDAFFKHSNKLPVLYSDLIRQLGQAEEIASIGVSSRPRNVEGSYMPCFRAGVNLAHLLSEIYAVPLYTFSHQEGHAAAVVNIRDERDDFLFMHLSGGTTEFLKCRAIDTGFEMRVVGGSLDISMGQLLDRFGVAAGFSFPAGMYIDELAMRYDGISVPGIMPAIRIDDAYFNLSGAETRLMELADDHISEDMLKAVSFEILERLSEILVKSAGYLCREYGLTKVYIAGGVASSSALRKLINSKLQDIHYEIIFGDPKLSGDNAVGVARLASYMYSKI